MYIVIINSMFFKHPKHKAYSWFQQLKGLQLKSSTFAHLQKQFFYFIHSSPPLSETSTKCTRTLNWPLINNLNRSWDSIWRFNTNCYLFIILKRWRIYAYTVNVSYTESSTPAAVDILVVLQLLLALPLLLLLSASDHFSKLTLVR